MKTKLLDLQTSEFLEKGKDWLDGGEYIVVTDLSQLDYQPTEECVLRYSLQEPSSFFSGFYNIYNKSNLSNLAEPLKSIVEKFGVSVYGGRYVLMQCNDNVKCGDITKNTTDTKRNYYSWIASDSEGIYMIGKEFGIKDRRGFYGAILGNIFTELSKYLRNEPNRFQEFKKLIGLN